MGLLVQDIADRVDPSTGGVYVYQAVIAAVFLHALGSWNLLPSALKRLEGFHVEAASCLTGMMPMKSGDQ